MSAHPLPNNSVTIEQLTAQQGQQVGLSDWFTLDQGRIDSFAQITEDEQFIHVDPQRARQTPFGGTIAHGFLTLSMLSAMSVAAVPSVTGTAMGVNYGFDSVRFLSPVPSGARVRGQFVLEDITPKSGGYLCRYQVSVQIEGQETPALVARWLVLLVMA